jgi:hypothetical protein
MFVAAASLLSFNLLLVVEEIVSDGTTCGNEDTVAVADEALRSLKKVQQGRDSRKEKFMSSRLKINSVMTQRRPKKLFSFCGSPALTERHEGCVARLMNGFDRNEDFVPKKRLAMFTVCNQLVG